MTIPVLMLGLGGFMFGGRALFGGEVTLFKGLNQMKRLAWEQSLLSVAALTIAAPVVVAAGASSRRYLSAQR